MKNKKILLFLTTFLVVLLLTSSPILASSDSEDGVIRVFGNAVITVAPDQCIIILGVETIGTDIEATMAESNEAINNVMAALKNLGLNDEQIRTGTFSVSTQSSFSWHMYIPSEETQYRVNNLLTITLDNLDMVGQVVDVAIASGANQVQSVQFGVRDSEALMLQALGTAVNQARVKAGVLASAAGVEITGVRSIQEDWGTFSPAMVQSELNWALMDMARGFSPAPSIIIIPNDVHIHANVTVVYNIR